MVAPSAAGLPPLGTSCGFTSGGGLSNDGGGIPSRTFSNSRELLCKLDKGPEGGLGVEIVLSINSLVTLQIETQRCPYGSGSAEAEHDPGAIGKADSDALAGTYRAIDRVVVGEIIGIGHLEATKAFSDQPGQFCSEIIHQPVGLGAFDLR